MALSQTFVFPENFNSFLNSRLGNSVTRGVKELAETGMRKLLCLGTRHLHVCCAAPAWFCQPGLPPASRHVVSYCPASSGAEQHCSKLVHIFTSSNLAPLFSSNHPLSPGQPFFIILHIIVKLWGSVVCIHNSSLLSHHWYHQLLLVDCGEWQ